MNGPVTDGFRDRVRLDEREKIVLSQLEFRARASVMEVADACGYKVSAVRHVLMKLLEAGVMTDRRAYLNPQALGFTNYGVYITLASWAPGHRASLGRLLTSAPRVTWLAELGGEYQYGITFSSYNPGEVIELRDRLSRHFPRVIASVTVSARVALWTFPRKYLGGSAKALPAWHQGASTRVHIDAVDAKILSELGRGGFDSFRHLAERTGVPASTFDRRVRVLEEKGIILDYYCRVDPSRIGFEDFRLLIHSRNVSRAITDRLFDFCRSHPNIRKFVVCISEWDYEVEISVPSNREVPSVIAALNERFDGEVFKVRVVPLLSEINRSPFPNGWFGG